MSSLTSSLSQIDNLVTIFVTEVIGDNLCIMCGSGKRLYQNIAVAFDEGKKVTLSFRDCEDITSAFLAELFSQLYENFYAEQIETCLTVVDLEPDDAEDLQYIIKDVKELLQYPQRFRNAIVSVMGEDYL
ncbi:MAG: STAS-like domain-containing protein [Calothrix sp. SM1_7_51]|nr:STAS-like domain-containing protein [Calothrix sp. SM1_7_51]